MALKRSRTVQLTLLASLGVTLGACARTPEYTRTSHLNQGACFNAYRQVPGLTRPCVQENGVWYGPYFYGAPDRHYLGYSPSGALLTSGIVYNTVTHRAVVYQEPRAGTLSRSVASQPRTQDDQSAAQGVSSVRRGGFGSSSRGSFGG